MRTMTAYWHRRSTHNEYGARKLYNFSSLDITVVKIKSTLDCCTTNWLNKSFYMLLKDKFASGVLWRSQ